MTDFEMKMLAFQMGQKDGFHDIILKDILTDAISVAGNNEEYQTAYGLRGTVYEEMGEKNNAISDYKKAADYGSDAALECLGRLGINYTPQSPSSSGGSPFGNFPPSSQTSRPASSSSSSSGSTTPNGRLTLHNGTVYEGNIVDGRGTGKGRFMNNNLLRFDGLYVDREILFDAYRFYDNGTFLTHQIPDKKEKITQDIVSEQSFTSKGTYSISGDEVTFLQANDQYTGKLSGNKLIINFKGEKQIYIFGAW